MSEYAGIDYGLGRTNVDRETGIRSGVISSHTVGERWYEDAEADYGDPTCPECGDKVIDSSDADEHEDAHKDYHCASCHTSYWSDQVYGDDPIGHHYEDADYRLTDCLDSDIMVLRSPYWTRAQYCSPCVPGAGNLDTPCEDGPRTYALGHEWYEDGKAPYRVYRVSDDSEVLPEKGEL